MKLGVCCGVFGYEQVNQWGDRVGIRKKYKERS